MPQIKYRAACDHCSATKIKCTQERPTCARCRSLGRDCHYSRSLRSGKPPRSSQGLNRRISNTPVLPRHDVPSDLNVVKPTETWNPVAAPYPTPPAMLPTNGPDTFQFNDFQRPDRRSSSISPATNPEWFMNLEHAPHCISNHPLATPLTETPPITTIAPPQCMDTEQKGQVRTPPDFAASFDDFICMPPPTPQSNAATPENSDKCIRIATETMNSLYEMPATQLDNAGTRRPSVDQALSTTAKAVQAMHDIVTCPCPKDYYMPMMFSTVVAKIIAWYQAIALITDPHVELPESKPCTREVVVDGPLALGAYQLDDSTGRRLKDQIVLAQLQKLTEVIDKYEHLHCEEMDQSKVDGARLYGLMEQCLRSRLQFTIREVEGRLFGGGREGQ